MGQHPNSGHHAHIHSHAVLPLGMFWEVAEKNMDTEFSIELQTLELCGSNTTEGAIVQLLRYGINIFMIWN